MRVFAKTDKGKARDINEDFYYISEDISHIKLYILADGMGGYNGGEIASHLATLAAKNYILEKFDKIDHNNKENILELIKEAMNEANQAVIDRAMENQELEQMGTTLEICLIYNNRAYIGHIGDSRIYRIRRGIIRRITTDHSYVQELVEDGTITKEEALDHPKKNMLTKALGCGLPVEPDIEFKNFLNGDVIVMCSDGLTNMVSELEIYNIITEYPEIAVDKLIEKANSFGGYDNVSVIIIMNS